MVHTDIPEAPWYVVESDVKKRARLNMMAHLLVDDPVRRGAAPALELPPRPPTDGLRAPAARARDVRARPGLRRRLENDR